MFSGSISAAYLAFWQGKLLILHILLRPSKGVVTDVNGALKRPMNIGNRD